MKNINNNSVSSDFEQILKKIKVLKNYPTKKGLVCTK